MPMPFFLDQPLWIWITAAVGLCWVVGAYNRLVRLRAMVIQHFSQLESQWLRHLAWIEVQSMQVAEPTSENRLPGDWSVVLPAIAQFRACLQATKLKPLDATLLGGLSSAWGVLQMACTQTIDPGQNGVRRVSELVLPQWEQMILQDLAALENFNLSVAAYNDAIQQFPAMFVAWLFGFRSAKLI